MGDGARRLGRSALGVLPEPARRSIRRALGRVDPWEPGAHLRPPACPGGMTVGPPDFVGVGAQKAGTTWWYDLLGSHPRLYNHPRAHKERHFFMRFHDRELSAADIAEYHRWFPRPPGSMAGEWTPDYMLHFWIPRLLKAAAPEARLLVLLRDPVDRIVSGLTHVAARQAPDARAATEAYLRGRYFEQLEALFVHFERAQVLVQQYERCCREPETELAVTLEFLGLPPQDLSAANRPPVNATLVPKVVLPDATVRELVGLYSPDVEKLAQAYPQIDLALWPNFASLAG